MQMVQNDSKSRFEIINLNILLPHMKVCWSTMFHTELLQVSTNERVCALTKFRIVTKKNWGENAMWQKLLGRWHYPSVLSHLSSIKTTKNQLQALEYWTSDQFTYTKYWAFSRCKTSLSRKGMNPLEGD